ncbi:MAG: hypothetical protein K2Q26_05405 [Bdellovibrionales bacterium]|nr:hypothetical protein [Bdellovibrionales bacterium]
MIKWLCLISYFFLLANQFTLNELEEQYNSSSPSVVLDWDGDGELDFDHEDEEDAEARSLGKWSLDIYSPPDFVSTLNVDPHKLCFFYPNLSDQNVFIKIKYPPRAS